MKNRIVLNLLAVGALVSGFLLSGCAPVTVGSTTKGASVYYKKSNKLIGPAPVKVTLYANSREVVVRKDGYFSKTVLLSPVGPENISVKLKKRDKVLILSRPSGAELFVEGKKVGKTPYRFDYDKSYRSFEVRLPGYAPYTLEIPSDPEGNLVAELEREPSIMIISKPKNVEVYDKDGQKLGVTPLAVPAVESCTLELRKEGYYSQEVGLDEETESPFVVELEREPIIIVYSDPDDALVVYHNVTVGKTPIRYLVKKEMVLEVSANRYYTKKVAIAPDSPRKVFVKLDPMPYITVNTTPPNAKLYRSGGVELVGSTPIEILVEKDTALEIHKPGFAVKHFVLSPKSNSKITVPLAKTTSSEEKVVRIDSTPSGAEVYRPGGAELIGTTPLEQPVRFERSFELHKPGYKTKIVTVAPDSSDTVVFALAKDGSKGNVTLSDPLLNTPASF